MQKLKSVNKVSRRDFLSKAGILTAMGLGLAVANSGCVAGDPFIGDMHVGGAGYFTALFIGGVPVVPGGGGINLDGGWANSTYGGVSPIDGGAAV